MARVVAFGELLLRLKAPGSERLLQSPALEASFGGAEFNVLASLAQFGADTGFVSVLPEGAIGAAAVAEIRRFGVDAAQVSRVPGRMGLYYLESGAQARPARVIFDRAGSAFATLDPARFDWPTLLAGIDLLHLTSIPAALGDAPLAALLAAARTARAQGARVSLDLNMRPALWAVRGRAPHACLEPVIAEATVLFAGPDDWSACLGGAAPVDAAAAAGGASAGGSSAAERFRVFAAAVLARYPRISGVITTLREARGADEQSLAAACVARDGTVATAGPRPLGRIVERIGGGDAFVAAFLHRKLERADWQSALDFGLAAAVLKHTIPGDVNRCSAEEVRALLDGDDGGRVQR